MLSKKKTTKARKGWWKPEYETNRLRTLTRALEMIQLLAQRPMTTLAIAEHFHLSYKTVHRYFTAIERAGIPIIVELAPEDTDDSDSNTPHNRFTNPWRNRYSVSRQWGRRTGIIDSA